MFFVLTSVLFFTLAMGQRRSLSTTPPSRPFLDVPEQQLCVDQGLMLFQRLDTTAAINITTSVVRQGRYPVCTWTGVFQNPLPDHVIALTLDSLDGFVPAGENFITVGSGTDDTDESSVIFHRSGIDTTYRGYQFKLRTVFQPRALWIRIQAMNTNPRTMMMLELVTEASCSDDYFVCDDGSCVEQEGKLNAYPDCPDGSDESTRLGFRDCVGGSRASGYLYTGRQRNEACIPWEEVETETGRGLTGRICSGSIGDTWPACYIDQDNLIKCEIPSCQERSGCYHGDGVEYRDVGPYTTSGYRCIDWAEVPSHMFNIRSYPDADLTSNYCRNPDGREKPWCFYRDVDRRIQSEPCAVDMCRNDVFDQFRRLKKISFDVGDVTHKEQQLGPSFGISEIKCAEKCANETSFTCRSFIYDADKKDKSTACTWTNVAPTILFAGGGLESNEHHDVFVKIQTECDSLLVDNLPAHCPLPLGMKQDLYHPPRRNPAGITDDDISASSYLSEDFHHRFVRYDSASCWKNDISDVEPWVQVDLHELHIITGIVMQACGDDALGWVEEFSIQSKTGNNIFITHTDRTSRSTVLSGNVEAQCAQVIEFDPWIYAESVRVLPVKWNNAVGLRFELLGCKNECDNSLGLTETDMMLVDSAITASSNLDDAHQPGDARIQPLNLHRIPRLGWSPNLRTDRDAGSWIQVDFGTVQNVRAIITKGCGASDSYLELFTIDYLMLDDMVGDANFLQYRYPVYGDQMVFAGNTNPDTIVRNDLPVELKTRYVRLNAISWGGSGPPCMKFDVIGCPHNVCSRSLSAYYMNVSQESVSPCFPRPSFSIHGDSTYWFRGTVSGQPFIIKSHLTVTLPEEYAITAVITQGAINGRVDTWQTWATKYTLEYSNGSTTEFLPYRTTDGATMVFDANFDGVTPVTNYLDRPVAATKLRLTVYNDQTPSLSAPCIRFDLIGCKVTETGYPCGPTSVNMGGYCMGTVGRGEDDACTSTYHQSSRLAVLNSPELTELVEANIVKLFLPGYSNYRIGLVNDPSATRETTSLVPFLWVDGTPVLYNRFEPDVVFDNSTTQCVTADINDRLVWRSLPCDSPAISRASLCQFDIDECLQKTDRCSDGCINYPGGYLCTCSEGMYLSEGLPQESCKSLCGLIDSEPSDVLGSSCIEYKSNATYEVAQQECTQSMGRLMTPDELLLVAEQSHMQLSVRTIWVEPPRLLSTNCYVAELEFPERGDVSVTVIPVPCGHSFSSICVKDKPAALELFTGVIQQNSTVNDSALYITWSGLPPYYEAWTSASLDIKVDREYILRIYFVFVNLRRSESTGRCIDTLDLWENRRTNRTRQGTYCGVLSGFNIETTTNFATLLLRIGDLQPEMPPYLTVQLFYEKRDCSVQDCNVYCESAEQNITDSKGYLQTFKFPEVLPPFYACSWTIWLRPGSFIRLHFVEVNIPCTVDHLINVFARRKGGTDLLDKNRPAVLCSWEKSLTISETNKLVITYDTGLNQQSEGFSAYYETSDTPGCGVVPRESEDTLCLDTRCTASRAYIASPKFPDPYGEMFTCRWTIQTSPMTYILLRFLTLEISDVTRCAREVLIIEDDEQPNMRYCGVVTTPFTHVSSRGSVVVRFTAPEGRFLAVYEEKRFTSSTPLQLATDGDYSCPDGWSLYDKRCFQVQSMEQNIMWTEAALQCSSMSNWTSLASIRNVGEANFVHNLTLSFSQENLMFYIGLAKLPDNHNDFNWIDGSPLSYTDWYNREYAYEEIQPDGGSIELCTAIEMRDFSRTDNWFDVPCAAEVTTHYVCATPAIADFPASPIERPRFQKEYCPNGFRKIGMRCLHVLSSSVSDEPFSCPGDSSLITRRYMQANLDSITFYFQFVWNVESPRINVEVEGGKTALCLERDTTGEFVLQNSTCNTTERVALCSREASVLNQRCLENQYSCLSGECINVVFVCDFNPDCADESDELNCTSTEVQTCDLSNHFTCTDETCIQSSFVCDFKNDCPDGSDETSCDFPDCQEDEYQCVSKQCVTSDQRCNLIRDCIDGTDEQLCVSSDGNFQCYSGVLIRGSAECDGHRDCTGQTFEDENVETCDYFKSNFSCDAALSIQCKNGVCTSRDNLCILDHDEYGYMRGCRDLTHLQHCYQFECSDLHYKCPQSYCIPQHYRCDGKPHCPRGEDEFSCGVFACDGAYRCRAAGHCLAQRFVCDGIKQCPMGDDEYFCGIECPSACSCNGLVYSCQGVTWSSSEVIKIPNNIRQLSLSNLQSSQRKRRQTATDNDVISIYDATLLNIHDFPFLYSLDLSSNGITVLGNGAFISNSNLHKLNLSFNAIDFLGNSTFDGLVNLRILDLQGNPMSVVVGSPFSSLHKLTFLSIEKSDVAVPEASFVTGLNSVEVFRSDRFYYCCLLNDLLGDEAMMNVECYPPADEFSSCTDLIRSVVQRILIWLMAISALSGNIIVIVLRLLKKADQNRRSVSAQPVLIMNLAIADLLMGCYLFMIAIADVAYRGRYGLFSYDWQTSGLCGLAGFLSTISSVTSVLFLTTISVDRCTSVLFPLSPHRLTVKSARFVCIVLWIIMIFLSALPAILYPGDYYGRSSVCLALPITEARPDGWLYSFLLFIVLNIILFLVIVACYTCIFIIARRSAKFSTSLSKTEQELKEEQLQIAIKVLLLVVSDFLCWMPIIIMGLFALTPRAVGGDVYAWTAILILPINSAVNPYLYTFLIERAQNKTKKPVHSRQSHQTGLTTPDSSPALQRLNPKITEAALREEQGVIKTAVMSIRLNRLLAPDPLNRYQNSKLSNLMLKQEFEMSEDEANDVIADVRKALEHLHKSGAAHGNITEEYIIIDELHRGNKRAYLLMCPASARRSTVTNGVEVTDPADIEMKTLTAEPSNFEEDIKQLTSLQSRLIKKS